jgi:hypothetical protein
MKLCKTRIARQLTGRKVRTECAERRSIEGQLKALFASAAFGKNCSKQHNQDRFYEYERLGGEYSVRKGLGRVEVSDI